MNRDLARLAVIIIATFGLALSVWAKRFALTAAHTVPAANGTVDTHVDKNGNTDVDVKVHDLARPTNLAPPATAYVVWFQAPGSEAQNEGELKVDDKLNGELKTETQLKTFDLMITAESDPAAKAPSGNQVMNANIQD